MSKDKNLDELERALDVIVDQMDTLKRSIALARAVSTTMNGARPGATRGEKMAATRAANRKAEEERQAAIYARRSKAMKKSWAARKAAAK
jgi:hypothetical protein